VRSFIHVFVFYFSFVKLCDYPLCNFVVSFFSPQRFTKYITKVHYGYFCLYFFQTKITLFYCIFAMKFRKKIQIMRKAWVIPDIHGCSKTLKALIEDMIRPSKYDWLYFLGDYIDRGPDSKGVIDYLMYLQEEEYNSRFLLGNHEDVFLKTYEAEFQKMKFLGIKLSNQIKKDWFDMFGHSTLDSFGVKNISDIPIKYIEWIKNLELYIELEK